MIADILSNILRFLFLIALQGLVLNDINLSVYFNPYLYLLFILLLPFEIPNWLLLILGFVTGVSVDMFTNTLGLHTSACVFMAFIRPTVLRILKPREGYELGTRPNLAFMGFSWFTSYAAIMIFMHHLWFFYLEMFRFSDFFFTFTKVIATTALNLLLVMLSQFLSSNPNERR